MRSLEEIIKLPVLSCNGEYLGVVDDLVLNSKELVGVGFLVRDKDWYRGMKFIERERIEVLGKNAILTTLESLRDVVEFTDVVKLLGNRVEWRGLPVYTVTGEMLGKVEELLIDDKSLALEGIRLYQGEDIIPRKNITAFGSFAVLVDLGEDKSSKVIDKKEEHLAQTQTEGLSFEARQSAYLIGKRLTRDIISEDGTVIASKDDAVTQQLIKKIRNLNRMQELINSVEQ